MQDTDGFVFGTVRTLLKLKQVSCSVEELEVGFEPQGLPANTGANMVWLGGREERLVVSLSGPGDSRPLSGSQL